MDDSDISYWFPLSACIGTLCKWQERWIAGSQTEQREIIKILYKILCITVIYWCILSQDLWTHFHGILFWLEIFSPFSHGAALKRKSLLSESKFFSLGIAPSGEGIYIQGKQMLFSFKSPLKNIGQRMDERYPYTLK